MNIKKKKKVVLGNNTHSKTNKPFTGETPYPTSPSPSLFSSPSSSFSFFFAHLPSSSFPLRTVFVDCTCVCLCVCMGLCVLWYYMWRSEDNFWNGGPVLPPWLKLQSQIWCLYMPSHLTGLSPQQAVLWPGEPTGLRSQVTWCECCICATEFPSLGLCPHQTLHSDLCGFLLVHC